MTKSNTLLKLELVNNLFLLFELEFVNIYKLLEQSNIEQQIIAVEKLKELNQVINDLSNNQKSDQELLIKEKISSNKAFSLEHKTKTY